MSLVAVVTGVQTAVTNAQSYFKVPSGTTNSDTNTTVDPVQTGGIFNSFLINMGKVMKYTVSLIDEGVKTPTTPVTP